MPRRHKKTNRVWRRDERNQVKRGGPKDIGTATIRKSSVRDVTGPGGRSRQGEGLDEQKLKKEENLSRTQNHDKKEEWTRMERKMMGVRGSSGSLRGRIKITKRQ